MIIARTPLRMSFVGGGTDLPDFADEHGGAVVSTSIDKWISVIVSPRFEDDLRVSYSTTEIVPDVSALQHELVREAMRSVGVTRGVEIVTVADVPSRGTGLGSSSAVTVGLLQALSSHLGIYRSPQQLAEEASRIEIEVLGKPIGRQDQYASAVGGFNLIEFLPDGRGVTVSPIVAPDGTLESLFRSLMLFHVGTDRQAGDVLGEQREATRSGSATEALTAMRDMAYEMRDALAAGDASAVGPLLHRNWQLKRGLTGSVSNSAIDDAYDAAMSAGATGGKLLGAGGGGFLLMCAPADRQGAVRAALSGLREVPFRFTARGSHVALVVR